MNGVLRNAGHIPNLGCHRRLQGRVDKHTAWLGSHQPGLAASSRQVSREPCPRSRAYHTAPAQSLPGVPAARLPPHPGISESPGLLHLRSPLLQDRSIHASETAASLSFGSLCGLAPVQRSEREGELARLFPEPESVRLPGALFKEPNLNRLCSGVLMLLWNSI